MKSICIYGKGGIGKSTISSNIACALAEKGLRVLLVGCDPKADSTRNVYGKKIPTVLNTMFDKGEELSEKDIVFKGYKGVDCVETGGPRPGDGCAGRGVVSAMNKMEELDIIDEDKYDMVIYDVLGDVVCGGFAMPIKESFAQKVYIVTTCDYMALYAANNICTCIEKYGQKGKVRLGGIILNERSVVTNSNIVENFARRVNANVIGRMPMDKAVTMAELKRIPLVEYDTEGIAAQSIRKIAENIWEDNIGTIPQSMTEDELDSFFEEVRDEYR